MIICDLFLLTIVKGHHIFLNPGKIILDYPARPSYSGTLSYPSYPSIMKSKSFICINITFEGILTELAFSYIYCKNLVY